MFLRLLHILKEVLGFVLFFREYENGDLGFTPEKIAVATIGMLSIYIVLIWLCLFKTEKMVQWLGLKKGFDMETESYINLGSASIIRIAIITLGGYLFITTIASFINSILNVLKIPNDLRDISAYSNCIIDAVYLIVGGIMLSFNAEITERILKSTKE